MKTVIYCRVSTKTQETENQRLALEQFAVSHGYTIVKTYSESESAWRAGQQHELAKLRKDAKRGGFDTLLVWALDRLSREGPLKVLLLVQRFQLLGVKIISMQESWTQIDGDMTELFYALTAWVSKYESDRRSERTKAGMVRKARECPEGRIPPRGKDKHKRKRRTARPAIYEGD